MKSRLKISLFRSILTGLQGSPVFYFSGLTSLQGSPVFYFSGLTSLGMKTTVTGKSSLAKKKIVENFVFPWQIALGLEVRFSLKRTGVHENFKTNTNKLDAPRHR